MTKAEFTTWQAFHAARFPMWQSWLNNLARDGATVKQADVLAAMFDTLADVTLNDAREATRALARGDEPEIDRYEDHPKVVRAVARRYSSDRIRAAGDKLRVVNGEPTYRCPKCQDVGMRTVFDAATMKCARNDPDGILSRRKHAYTCIVACTCHRGEVLRTNGMPQIRDDMLELENALNYGDKLRGLVEYAQAVGGNQQVYDFGQEPNGTLA